MKIADELQDKAMGIKSLGWEQDPAIDIHFIGNCLD